MPCGVEWEWEHTLSPRALRIRSAAASSILDLPIVSERGCLWRCCV